MKAELFKKLIKEAVREVVREEFPGLVSENSLQNKPTIQHITKYEEFKSTAKQPVKTGDPIADILNETRASMTQETYRDLMSATSDMVQAQGIGMNPVEDFQPGPAPGVDLSTLSFAKNAGAIFKASIEKDKARFGG